MIPVITARAKTTAEAYEKILIQLSLNGVEIKTQYDKPGDPLSIDATANITIDEPFTDPLIHKSFPGGIEDLREYVYELQGLKDDWVKVKGDPKDTRWEYTYHERLAHWGTWMGQFMSSTGEMKKGRIKPSFGDDKLYVDQIKAVIEKLSKDPFTRQAQMITWVPYLDTKVYDPPCLQRIWFRLTEENGKWFLNTNISFRSNDAYGAFMMNCFGLTMFIQEQIIEPLKAITKKEIYMGRMNWQADSFHIYGKDRKDFEGRFLGRIKNSTFQERVINFWDKDIQEYYHEVEKGILDKIKNYKT